MMRMMQTLRRRMNAEGGFTIVEAMISITILAVGALAVAQSITFGLETTGLARNRLTARAHLEQQMELSRALNFDSLVLDDSAALTHSSDPNNPDYWISNGSEMFDPDGGGSLLSAEPIVREAGASPALHHCSSSAPGAPTTCTVLPNEAGNVSFTTYMYVTWFDSPTDGTGGSDAADGNGDGESDANGQDGKRVVVVVVWTDPVTGETQQQRAMSLFSTGIVPYNGTTVGGTTGTASNTPPTVTCPSSSASDLSYTFTANATDSDGTVTQIDWKIYDSTQTLLSTYTNQGATLAYQFQDDGMYFVVNNVADNNGATADNDSLDCSVTASTTTNNAAGNGGPSGTVSIAAGATYTTTTLVNLTLYSATAAKMQFSSDGSTWTSKTAYATSSLFTLNSGDGTKTVYARYWANGKYGPWVTDTIILDATAPGAPTSLAKDATYTCTTSGPDKICKLKWVAPSPLAADLAGYRVYVRNTNSTTWAQQACNAGSTTLTCIAQDKKNNNYEFYVVSYDTAGNQSAQSNHITVAY